MLFSLGVDVERLKLISLSLRLFAHRGIGLRMWPHWFWWVLSSLIRYDWFLGLTIVFSFLPPHSSGASFLIAV